MPQLTIAIEPGIANFSEAILASGQYAADELLLKLNHLFKFAAVRKELFNMGYYHAGDQPPVPRSPVDNADLEGDINAGNELLFLAIYASTAEPSSGLIPGQVSFPSLAPYSAGRPLVLPYVHRYNDTLITDTSGSRKQDGKLIEELYAFRTSDQDAQIFEWGCALVFCMAQRLGIFGSAISALQPGDIVTIAGAVSQHGTNFNGAWIVDEVLGLQAFTFMDAAKDYPNCVNDAGGGGTVTFGDPPLTAPIVASPNGIKIYNTGQPGCGLVRAFLAAPFSPSKSFIPLPPALPAGQGATPQTWNNATPTDTTASTEAPGNGQVSVSFTPTGSITGGTAALEIDNGQGFQPLDSSCGTSVNLATLGGPLACTVNANVADVRVRLTQAITGTGNVAVRLSFQAAAAANSYNSGDQTGPVSGTLSAPNATGLYRISGYLLCSVAGAGTVTLLLSWTDDSGAQGPIPSGDLGLGVRGYFQPIQRTIEAVAGQPVNFSTALAGYSAPGAYRLFLKVETI